jgi:hypothetical protein
MIDSNEALARLRDARPDGPAARLAALLVDDVLGRTLRELVDPALVVGALCDGIRAITASDEAAAHVTRELERATRELAAQPGPVGAHIPQALKDGMRELAQLGAEPHREAVLTLLDRDPLRALLRAQVIDTLVAFGKKATSPVADSAIARGLGGLSKRAFGQIASRPSPLGSLANAVSGEVERQMEKRATDFADTAVDGILAGIAAQVSDPARAAEQAAVRLALLDGFLELTGSELADLTRSNVGERVAVVRKAFAAWAADPAFPEHVEAVIAKILARDGDRTVRDLLADVALADSVAEHARIAVRRRIDAIVATDAFAAWLRDLLTA